MSSSLPVEIWEEVSSLEPPCMQILRRIQILLFIIGCKRDPATEIGKPPTNSFTYNTILRRIRLVERTAYHAATRHMFMIVRCDPRLAQSLERLECIANSPLRYHVRHVDYRRWLCGIPGRRPDRTGLCRCTVEKIEIPLIYRPPVNSQRDNHVETHASALASFPALKSIKLSRIDPSILTFLQEAYDQSGQVATELVLDFTCRQPYKCTINDVFDIGTATAQGPVFKRLLEQLEAFSLDWEEHDHTGREVPQLEAMFARMPRLKRFLLMSNSWLPKVEFKLSLPPLTHLSLSSITLTTRGLRSILGSCRSTLKHLVLIEIWLQRDPEDTGRWGHQWASVLKDLAHFPSLIAGGSFEANFLVNRLPGTFCTYYGPLVSLGVADRRAWRDLVAAHPSVFRFAMQNSTLKQYKEMEQIPDQERKVRCVAQTKRESIGMNWYSEEFRCPEERSWSPGEPYPAHIWWCDKHMRQATKHWGYTESDFPIMF